MPKVKSIVQVIVRTGYSKGSDIMLIDCQMQCGCDSIFLWVGYQWGSLLKGIASYLRSNLLFRRLPLVDPNCWIQSVEFAISINNHGKFSGEFLDVSNLRLLTANKFMKSSFVVPGREPRIISGDSNKHGADLLFWISFGVYRKKVIELVASTDKGDTHLLHQFVTCKMDGSIFVHGIFFPHQAEPSWTSKEVGTKLALYFPKTKHEILTAIPRRWERY